MADIATIDDIKQLLEKQKREITEEFRQMISNGELGGKRWLKNADLMKMLGLSYTGIQNLRIKGLPYSKVQGTIFYDRIEIEKYMQKNKVQ